METVASDHFLFRLWRGEYGLARTYWLYDVVINAIFQFALLQIGFDPASLPYLIFYVMLSGYFFVVYVGVWRAAGSYQGTRILAYLARFAVALSALLTLVMLLSVIRLNLPLGMKAG